MPPGDLSLMERLVGLEMTVVRLPQAYDVMVKALRHPAGATRLLAGFMRQRRGRRP